MALLVVSKPIGPTSAKVVESVKRVLKSAGVQKVGHGGTLDSFANGVLVLGIDAGTTRLSHLLHTDKKYIAIGRLGTSTDTYEHTGIHSDPRPVEHINTDHLLAALAPHRGHVLQQPPLYSALKQNGKRVSDRVRAGEAVVTNPRPVTVHALELRWFRSPDFEIELHCGHGFYVRTLVHDIGQALQCGAHTLALQRTMQGPFTIDHAVPEDQWSPQALLAAMQEHTAWWNKLGWGEPLPGRPGKQGS